MKKSRDIVCNLRWSLRFIQIEDCIYWILVFFFCLLIMLIRLNWGYLSYKKYLSLDFEHWLLKLLHAECTWWLKFFSFLEHSKAVFFDNVFSGSGGSQFDTTFLFQEDFCNINVLLYSYLRLLLVESLVNIQPIHL